VEGRKARPLAVDSILRIQDVSKRFGGLAALTNVSVEVARGKITALIGPNGSGKTTLFNVICGLLPSDGGTIAFDDASITGLAPYEVVSFWAVARSVRLATRETRMLFASVVTVTLITVTGSTRLRHTAATAVSARPSAADCGSAAGTV